LKLRLKYDNGFVAYLNGAKVAEANAPSDPQWFSPAPNRVPRDSQALEFVEFDVSQHVPQLVDGTNVLAIHAMNNLGDRDDMLLVPELVASINRPTALPGYMSAPTPGSESEWPALPDQLVPRGLRAPRGRRARHVRPDRHVRQGRPARQAGGQRSRSRIGQRSRRPGRLPNKHLKLTDHMSPECKRRWNRGCEVRAR